MVDGRRLGVEQQEETLTESLLLEIIRKSRTITVHTFSRTEEGRTGADWAWWWEGDRRWFGAIVQAKRLNQRTGQVDFGYRTRPSGSNPAPERHIDLLLEAARDLQLPPLYVLYNVDHIGRRPRARASR